jgi:hypothetical protein
MLIDISEELTASITRAMGRMEAVGSSETTINICQTTWCDIPEENHRHQNQLLK